MMVVERNPLDFDGAIAGDPAFRLTHAAIAETLDTQAFEVASPKDSEGHPILSESFSRADLKLVADAVLAKYDELDVLKDSEINNWLLANSRPPTSHVEASCLSPVQVKALDESFGGAHDSPGNPLYSTRPYDAGIGNLGWRMWKLGTSETAVPIALNTALDAMSLRDYFVRPNFNGLPPMNLDFDRAAAETDQTARIHDVVSTGLSTFMPAAGN